MGRNTLGETIFFRSYRNDTEAALLGINMYYQTNKADLHVNDSTLMQAIETNSSNPIESPAMDNSILWVMVCDLFGGPCMLAFLYVLYRGIEVISISFQPNTIRSQENSDLKHVIDQISDRKSYSISSLFVRFITLFTPSSFTIWDFVSLPSSLV